MAAESEIAGPILESALPVLAALAMAQAIVAIINKVRDLISSFRELSDEEKGAIDARVESLKKSISFDRQVLAIRRETILVGKSEAEQARLRAQWAAEDANEDKHYLERARKKYDDAKALLAAAEKGETKQVESDYRNPRTGMRAVHNVPVISDEQIKDAKAKIQTLEGLYGAGLQDLSRETLLFNEKSALADKQAGQARIDGQKQQNQSVTALQSANAKDVQAVQKDSNDKQAQEDERRKQEAIRAEQQKNEAIKKAEADAREAQEETIKGEIEDAKLKEQTEEQLVQQQFIKGQISKQQEIAALATAKQNELQIEIDYWRAIEQLHQGDQKAVARIEAQITKLTDEQVLMRAKAVTDSLTEQQKQYQKMEQNIRRIFSGMQSVFSGFTRDLLSGNKSISQSWDKMVDDIATKFVEGLEKQLMAFLQKKVMEIAIHAQTEETKEAISKATTQKEDLRTAYSAAKNAWKATAGIDIVGPVLAPIAAAAAFAGVVSFGSAEGGQYYVPNNQLTMLHPQEMVLPAGIANQMRSVIGGGGGGGGTTVIVNHSVNAVDAASFQQHIRRHSNMIANEVTRALKRKA